MRTKEANTSRQKSEECASGEPGAQCSFVVLSVKPCGGGVSDGDVQARCKEIRGVNALRVDADRGKIHILYDGTVATIEQVEHALRMLGLVVCHHDKGLSV